MNPFAKQTTTKARSRRNRRRGAVALEFAMVAPAFVLVIVVCAEFARLSMMRNLAQNAAYEGARFVMTEGGTIADGIDRANTILSRLGTQGAEITINGFDGSLNELGDVDGEIAFDTEQIQCAITIALSENSVIIPASILGDTTISASMTIRTERYRGYFDADDID